MSESKVTVRLTQRSDYQFDNHFGGEAPALLADEPPPLGQGQGPSPVQLLCAAVGNCLAASLLFSLRKLRQESGSVGCEIDAEVGRSADKRLRVLSMQARLSLGVAGDRITHLERVLASFEDYCTVTASVRAAIPVEVQVVDVTGRRLK
ncbi:MAG: hypothetical protein RL375_1653 [Pseudomonadota bacterium]